MSGCAQNATGDPDSLCTLRSQPVDAFVDFFKPAIMIVAHHHRGTDHLCFARDVSAFAGPRLKQKNRKLQRILPVGRDQARPRLAAIIRVALTAGKFTQKMVLSFGILARRIRPRIAVHRHQPIRQAHRHQTQPKPTGKGGV